jgi:hypothetical protein
LYICKTKAENMTTAITPADLRKKLELQQAKAWGYKTIAAAYKDGMNVKRNTCTVSEMKVALKMNDLDARILVDSWKSNGLIQYNRVCGLDQIVFL